MARKRMIDPDIWEDEKLSQFDFAGRLFFIGLISHSNDFGKLRGNIELLRSKIFPYDGSKVKIDFYIKRLVSLGIVESYKVNNEQYLKIKNWHKYQKLEHPAKDLIPEPYSNSPKEIVKVSRELRETSATSQVKSGQYSIKEVKSKKNNDFLLSLLTGLHPKEQAAIINSWCPGLQARTRCYDCFRCESDLKGIIKKVNGAKPDKYAAYLLKAINNFITGE